MERCVTLEKSGDDFHLWVDNSLGLGNLIRFTVMPVSPVTPLIPKHSSFRFKENHRDDKIHADFTLWVMEGIAIFFHHVLLMSIFVSVDTFRLPIGHVRPVFIAPVMWGRQNLITSP